MKKIISAVLALTTFLLPLTMASCDSEADPNDVIMKSATEITLNGSSASCENETVYINAENRVTITRSGNYKLSGTLDDGQIWVECVDAGSVNLILNGVTVSNSDGACIVIKKAQEAVITLADGTKNSLSDGERYVFEKPEDDEPDAVIYSKEDVVFNGNGKLIVDANYDGAIYSKDGLKIDGGEFELDSVNHGIKGKDYLVINGGKFDIKAVGDGIKSTNYETELVGYIEINGGDLTIYSEDEAIQAVTNITFNGGSTKITSLNNGVKTGGRLNFNGGDVSIEAQDNALSAVEIVKGEGCTVTINGNPFNG